MKKSRNISNSVKMGIAHRQNYTCANFINNTIIDYKCPMNGKRFDQSGFDVDHIVEFSITQDNSLSNLQALCLLCHRVKTNRFVGNRKKRVAVISKPETNTMYMKLPDVLPETKVELPVLPLEPRRTFNLLGYNMCTVCKEFNDKNSFKLCCDYYFHGDCIKELIIKDALICRCGYKVEKPNVLDIEDSWCLKKQIPKYFNITGASCKFDDPYSVIKFNIALSKSDVVYFQCQVKSDIDSINLMLIAAVQIGNIILTDLYTFPSDSVEKIQTFRDVSILANIKFNGLYNEQHYNKSKIYHFLIADELPCCFKEFEYQLCEYGVDRHKNNKLNLFLKMLLTNESESKELEMFSKLPYYENRIDSDSESDTFNSDKDFIDDDEISEYNSDCEDTNGDGDSEDTETDSETDETDSETDEEYVPDIRITRSMTAKLKKPVKPVDKPVKPVDKPVSILAVKNTKKKQIEDHHLVAIKSFILIIDKIHKNSDIKVIPELKNVYLKYSVSAIKKNIPGTHLYEMYKCINGSNMTYNKFMMLLENEGIIKNKINQRSAIHFNFDKKV